MIFIRFEEQKLEEKFQGIWTEYKNNVRRWI
jgi:protein-S-isoprenylcysteine O-methyltransferase Ste14